MQLTHIIYLVVDLFEEFSRRNNFPLGIKSHKQVRYDDDKYMNVAMPFLCAHCK